MIFLVVFIFAIQVTAGNVGTTLFHRRLKKDCWHEDEIAKLRARKIFQNILPPTVTPDQVNSKYVTDILKYFRTAFTFVNKGSDGSSGEILKEALADTIGGHLRRDLLPTVRYAYYAGYIPYKKARQIQDFYDELKAFLNTQGLGWKSPDRVPQWNNLTVSKILLGTGRILDPCRTLVTKRDINSCIHLPIPKVDDPKEPASIALPFKCGGLFSLKSPNSENILLKYYTTAARCILHNSPEACRHTDFIAFNNDLWRWMKRDVAPHLAEENIQTAYKGVLRIAAAVQNYGKGLLRRNLFEDHTYSPTFWYPWGVMKDTYLFLDARNASKFSFVLVIVLAAIITLAHVVVRYLWPVKCRCVDPKTEENEMDPDQIDAEVDQSASFVTDAQPTAYVKINPKFGPSNSYQLNVHCIEERKASKSASKYKTPTGGSVKTQRVYDLNENTEKLMSIIVSDNEDSLSVTDSDEGVVTNRIKTDRTNRTNVSNQTKRCRSPPQLHTPVTQLKINKQSSCNRLRLSKFSESTMTERTCQDKQASDTPWSGSGTSVTSSSDHSVTSTSECRTKMSSRSSRELTWARKVLSKSFVQDEKNCTSPELDANIYKTPPSHRESKRKT